MKRLDIGDRVDDDLLGEGVVVQRQQLDFYLVRWDTPPPVEYSGGMNPCLWRPLDKGATE